MSRRSYSDEWIYELSIARINVIGGQSFIEQSQIMDERYDEDVCGLVRSLLDLNVDEAMEHIDAEIQKFRDDFSNVNNYPMATQAQAEGASWLIAYMSPRNTRQLIQANTPYQIIHDQAIPNGTKELEVNIPNGSDVRGLKIQINTFLSLSNASGGSGSTTQGVIPYLVVGNTDINLVGHVGNLRLGGWNIASSFNDPGRVYERFAEAVWIWNQNNRIGTPASDNSRGLSKILTLDYNNTSPATYYNTNANLNSNNRKLKISIPQSAGILSADVSFRKGSRLKVWAIYDDWSF
ncbi:hypothetical protein JCM19037_1422 [Geomicrobium sp. JCM 19037]|uniref:hypothetical protein n=1 Tax=Geomicrobium sp. JCM 19037 TaxID=1460634 RepID=UPI00045F335E|nr:hypothetical protein [Geomicrobium sp. JCM 19037]GAK03128.1 hypothetical protein JCM19037_1422 [Geomicrobium sp. JCM 19037]